MNLEKIIKIESHKIESNEIITLENNINGEIILSKKFENVELNESIDYIKEHATSGEFNTIKISISFVLSGELKTIECSLDISQYFSLLNFGLCPLYTTFSESMSKKLNIIKKEVLSKIKIFVNSESEFEFLDNISENYMLLHKKLEPNRLVDVGFSIEGCKPKYYKIHSGVLIGFICDNFESPITEYDTGMVEEMSVLVKHIINN